MSMKLCLQIRFIEIFLIQEVSPPDGPYNFPARAAANHLHTSSLIGSSFLIIITPTSALILRDQLDFKGFFILFYFYPMVLVGRTQTILKKMVQRQECTPGDENIDAQIRERSQKFFMAINAMAGRQGKRLYFDCLRPNISYFFIGIVIIQKKRTKKGFK